MTKFRRNKDKRTKTKVADKGEVRSFDLSLNCESRSEVSLRRGRNRRVEEMRGSVCVC